MGKWLFNRPNLVVYAEPESPFIAHTRLNLEAGDPIENVARVPADYYRVAVENRGRSAANGCRLQVVSLLFVEHGVWRSYDHWEPITLVWSRRPDEHQITIAPGEQAFCDVGHYYSNYVQNNVVRPTQHQVLGVHQIGQPARFYLDGRNMPNNQPNALAAGNYFLTCKLLSSDHSTQNFAVRLRLRGQFADIAAEVPEGTRFEAVKTPPEVQTLYNDQ